MNKKTNNCYFIIASIVSSVLAGVIVFLTIFFNIKKKPDEEKKADDDVLKKEIAALKKEHDQLLTQIPKDVDWQIYDVDDFYNEEAQKIFQQQKEQIKKEIKDLNVTCDQSDLKAQKQCLLDCNQKVKQTINNFNYFNHSYYQSVNDFNQKLKNETECFQKESEALRKDKKTFDDQDSSFYNIEDFQNDYQIKKQDLQQQKKVINDNISALTNVFHECQNNKTKLQQYACYQQLNSNVTKVQETLEKLKINFTRDFNTANNKINDEKQKLDKFQKSFHDFQTNNSLIFIKAVIPNIALVIPEKFDTNCQQQTLRKKYDCLCHLLVELRENMTTIKTNYPHYLLDYLRYIVLFPISLYTFDNNKTFSQFQDVKNTAISYLNNYLSAAVQNLISTVDFALDMKNLLIKIKKINQQQYEKFFNATDPFKQEQKLPDVKIFQNFTSILAQIVNVDKITFDYQNFAEEINIVISSNPKNKIRFFNLNNTLTLDNNLIANLVACEKKSYCHDNYLGYYQSLLFRNFVAQYGVNCKQKYQQMANYWQKQLNQLKSVPTNIKNNFIYVNGFNNQIKQLLETFIAEQRNQQIKDKINNITVNDYNLYQTIKDLEIFGNQTSNNGKLQKQIGNILKDKLKSFDQYNGDCNEIFDIFNVLKFNNEYFKNYYGIGEFNKKIEILHKPFLKIRSYDKVLMYSTDVEKFVLEILKNGKKGFHYVSGQSFKIDCFTLMVNFYIIMRYRGLKKVTYNNVIKIDGNNQNIYNKLNMLVDMYWIISWIYFFYSLFFNYQYDFSDLNLDKLHCQNYSTKKNGTKVCNSYVLIYEGEDNYNYECGLSEKIAAQEDLFMNKQSSAAKIRFWSLSSSALLLIIYYYFLSCQEYIKTQRVYKGGVVRHPWYVRFFQFIFRLKINNNLNG